MIHLTTEIGKPGKKGNGRIFCSSRSADGDFGIVFGIPFEGHYERASLEIRKPYAVQHLRDY